MKNEDKENKYCKECHWFSGEYNSEKKHYWWCPAQDDATLLRNMVEKFKEIYEKFN